MMRYEDRIRKVLELARDAEDQGDLNKLNSLEKSLIKARIYRLDDPEKADQILDKTLRRCGNNDR